MKAATILVMAAFLSSNVSCFSDREPVEPVTEAGACQIPLSAIGANKTVVLIRNFTFFPDTVRISAGDEVTWINCETTVADFHTSTSDDGIWNSGALNRGEFYARTFTTAGDFEYFCEPHAFMQGAVIVE
jgi:plastocyanin